MFSQLDLREEAVNLDKFRANFAGDASVVFPRPHPWLRAEGLLVESYEHGVPLTEYLYSSEKVKKR